MKTENKEKRRIKTKEENDGGKTKEENKKRIKLLKRRLRRTSDHAGLTAVKMISGSDIR